MKDEEKLQLIRQVMGASHVFCSTMGELLERTLAEASDEQLGMAQVKLLLLISRPGQRFKVTDVADFLGVTNAASSRAIERLVQRGLVERAISADDRRAVDLSLTEASRELLERFTGARDAALLKLLGDYPEEKLQRAASLLDELSVLLLDRELEEEERWLAGGVHFREGYEVRDALGRECTVARALFGSNHEAGSGS